MSERESTTHPAAESLAQFAEGSLSRMEIAAVSAHLAECVDCRTIVGETARFLTENIGSESRRPISRSWLVAAAIAAAAVSGLLILRTKKPMQLLLDGAPHDVRFVEPRLSGGFPWAPIVDIQRGSEDSDPRQMELTGIAGRVLQQTANDTSPDAQHAAAIAHLLTGNTDQAIMKLTALAEKTGRPDLWSDLSAAHYVATFRTDSPDHLKDALAAADQALRIDSRFAEALFNRALILERFHLRDAAIDAWKTYLGVDPDGPWASEAQKHLKTLSEPIATLSSEVDRLYVRLQDGDRDAALSLLRFDAGEARNFGECEGLGRWGEAWLRGDTKAAARHLIAMRTLGETLLAFNEEPLLIEATRAIDRAGEPLKASLARAHVAFREGRRLYRQERKPIQAAETLALATEDFQRASSPMASEARIYTGVALFGQNRIEEAEAIFRELDRGVPIRYAALRAYIRWQQASCFMARAQWGPSIALMTQAMEIYDRQKETVNGAYVRDIVSQCYDAAGDRERAGRNRLLALRELGKAPSFRLEHAVSGMVKDATRHRDWRAAMSFLTIELDIARRVQDKELQTMALLHRALAHARLGAPGAADSDMREAKAVVASVADDALRAKLEIDRIGAAALVSNEPATAIPLLSTALKFHETKGWRGQMPNLYLRRGRMFLARGERDRAARDFEAGILELETHRDSLSAGEQRWGALDAAEELFDEAIEIALRDGPDRALAYAERERARSLSDLVPAEKVSLDFTTMPPDVMILELAALPHELVVFTITRSGCRAIERPVDRAQLAANVARLSDSMSGKGPDRSDGVRRSVHQALLEPVRDVLSSYHHLIFVPDVTTSPIPFAALTDPVTGRALIEDHTVSVLPSARSWMHGQHQSGPGARARILIVDSPADGELGELSFASSEATAIEAQYAVSLRLSGRDATLPAFLENVRDADVIHFAGHAIGGDESAALLFSSAAGQSGRIDAAAISRLPLAHTKLVVLAACASARGPARGKDGVLGVAYGFLQAGAPAVIATLWPISDRDAADFFPRLHRHLARGIPPSEALRLAQLEYIRQPTNNRSHLWAAVQLHGF